MALFGISRYLGEDENGQNAKENSKAETILENLHKQAKIRKKERESLGGIESPTVKEFVESTEILTVPKKKSRVVGNKESREKKRKHRRESDPSTPSKKHLDESVDSDEIVSNEDVASLAPASAKKRRKSKLLSSSESAVSSPKKTKQEEKSSLTDTSDSSDEDENDMECTAGDSDDELKENHEHSAGGGQSHSEIGGFTLIGDVSKQRKQKVQRVLPDWLANPSVITADIRNKSTPLGESLGLDEDLTRKLSENGVTHLFPVQAQVIPALLESCRSGHLFGKGGYRPSDICCSAPTGSGKTLAFALPIIQSLKKRVVCSVRALVVLPVRDLATQVYKVFQTYCKDTHIKVGLIIGQKTFSSEQQSLVRQGYHGFQSRVDIVIATPGRLVDHLDQTEGFSLKQLRFLVIDEADRMMEEVQQDWLTLVERAVYEETTQPSAFLPKFDLPLTYLPSATRTRPAPPSVKTASRMEIPLQKLLFSATLSQNPEKLQQLNLFQPKLFTSVVNIPKPAKSSTTPDTEESEKETTGDEVGKAALGTPVVTGEFVGKYTTPGGLTEYYVQCSVGEKPLVMLYILLHLKFKHILCFTNSIEATHRLYTLVKLVGGVEVREFSSSLHAVKRGRILRQFAAGKIDLLICSDAMARGMDVDNVQCVISYEAPPFLKTYIHRVGRTARAGRVGSAMTLLDKKEIFHFKRMLKDAGKTGFKEMKIKPLDLKEYVTMYQSALKEMPDVLKAEKRKHRR